MDSTAIGTQNSASYLPRAQIDLDGPFSAARQQDTAAQVQTQTPVQPLVQLQQAQGQAPQPLTAAAAAGRGGSIGQVLDIST